MMSFKLLTVLVLKGHTEDYQIKLCISFDVMVFYYFFLLAVETYLVHKVSIVRQQLEDSVVD